MGNNKSRLIIGGIAVLLLLFFTVGFAAAGEFSANFKEQQGDNVKTGKISLKDMKYVLEVTEREDQIRVIVDMANKTTTIIQFSAKEYRQIAIDDMMSVMNDPFQGYEYTKQHGDETSAGTESVSGYDCEKFTIVMSDTPIMSKWVSSKLGFPVKVVATGPPDKVIELLDIVEGPVDESLFVLPDGFTAWVDPDSKPGPAPEWVDDIEAAPFMVAPFEKDMKAGDIVRVKIEQGKSLSVKSVSETDGVAKVIPFIGKNPQKEESHYNNFAMQGIICQRRHELSGEVDEFVIRVYEGNIKVIAKWQEMFEVTASAGDEVRYKIEGYDNISTRFINLTDGSATATFNYYVAGQPMSEDEAGPAKYRKIELENPWDAYTSGFVAKGDEIVIRVETGKMQIKLGQFDSFKF